MTSATTSYERILRIGALLSVATNEPAIVVGGSAIEVYLTGGYVSGDIDVVVERRPAAIKVVESWGFIRTGRIWWREDWNIEIDLARPPYTGSREHLQTIQTPYGPVLLAAIEDLIVKRLAELKHWQNSRAREEGLMRQAEQLAVEYADRLDEGYLDSLARRYDTADVLVALRRRVGDRRQGVEPAINRR
ncbi:MAG: hypothetical protein ABSB97_04760 [Thermoplasmata archaeon]